MRFACSIEGWRANSLHETHASPALAADSSGVGRRPDGGPDEVTKWNELANQLALNSGLADQHPLFQTRMLAMTHAAMHDAVICNLGESEGTAAFRALQ